MLAAVLGLVAVVLLTLGTAVFVAAEFSLVALDRAELEGAARAGDRGARRALVAVRSLSFQLSGAQLGITITTLAVGFLAEPSLSRLLRPVLSATGLPHGAVETVDVVLALLFATVLQMVLGELIPKNWAIARPLPVARLVAAPMRAFTLVLHPVITSCNALANVIVRRLGVEPQEELRSARTATELDSLVRSSAEGGTLPQATATLLARSLRFGDKTAGEIMTPRTRLVALPASASVAELLAVAARSGHSRFPVAAGADVDELDQVVHVKQAFAVPTADRAGTQVGSIARPLPRVPESLALEPLTAQLRRPGLQMAAVIDEYGGTAGIVTLEDAVEELVGEVGDEYDPADPAVVRLPDGSIDVPAALRLDEVAEVVPGFAPPEGPYDTVGGLLLALLGRLAQPGDTASTDGWRLTALSVVGRRIETIRIAPWTS